MKVVELKEGGEEEEVTKENAREYVERYLQWVLEESVRPHFDAFRKGFMKVGREGGRERRRGGVSLVSCLCLKNNSSHPPSLPFSLPPSLPPS
jgi:hypothetical protein